MRRWIWPYALLAVVLTLAGLFFLFTILSGTGMARAGAQVSVANAVMVEPARGFLIWLLDLIAPFSVPGWIKILYANLVLFAVAGLALAAMAGLLLLPVFYALYRGSVAGDD